jgi:hypothetical protein
VTFKLDVFSVIPSGPLKIFGSDREDTPGKGKRARGFLKRNSRVRGDE